MKGILLCGGTGSRLRPLTKVMNKNLLPVGRDPMILYPLRKMAEAGIKKICIVTGADHMGSVVDLLGSGGEYGVDITYRVQDKPGGIAQAIGLAEDFVGLDYSVTILGDNLFDANLSKLVQEYEDSEPKYPTSCLSPNDFGPATVLVKEVPDPERFGVVEYSNGVPTKIVEKPEQAPSSDAVIGVYLYPPCVFDKIRNLQPSARGELEVTDLNNLYLREGRLQTHKVEGFWIDAGTFEALQTANEWAYVNADL